MSLIEHGESWNRSLDRGTNSVANKGAGLLSTFAGRPQYAWLLFPTRHTHLSEEVGLTAPSTEQPFSLRRSELLRNFSGSVSQPIQKGADEDMKL
jgi:hypothetical protein